MDEQSAFEAGEGRPFRILVAVDASPQSELAIELALQVAERMPDAVVHIVTVLEEEAAAGTAVAANDEEVMASGLPPHLYAAWLGRMARRLAPLLEQRKKARFDLRVVVGPPPGALVSAARALDADLLVIGAHGERDVHRQVLGSVADVVARRAHCPVLLVRDRRAATTARSSWPPPRTRSSIPPPPTWPDRPSRPQWIEPPAGAPLRMR